jgi:hypothetical protein
MAMRVSLLYVYSGLIACGRDFGEVFNWGVTHIGGTLYFFLSPRALVLLALLAETLVIYSFWSEIIDLFETNCLEFDAICMSA